MSFDHLRCDAASFADAIEADDDQRALELYAGDFLSGFHLSDEVDFERWLERTLRLEPAYRRLLEETGAGGAVA